MLIILSRISSHVDAQLLDSQSAFRKGRGLTDALFTIRQVISKFVEFNEPLFMALGICKRHMSQFRGSPFGRSCASMVCMPS